MVTNTLDQWVTTAPKQKKPVVLSDAHAIYLYEQSFHRQLEKFEDEQIERFLEEERAAEKAHKEYTEKRYIRVGGH